MDCVKSTANAAGFVQKITKGLKFRTAGIAPDKSSSENGSDSTIRSEKKEYQNDTKNNQTCRNREAMEALFSQCFASISSLKAAYAQMQIAQTPFDPENIQLADRIVVSELKNLSELKHSYLKNRGGFHFPSLQESQISAEIIEQKNVIKTYEIMLKKYKSQILIKDSEILSLRETLEEANQEYELLEKSQTGFMVLPDDLQLSQLKINHFINVLQFTVRAVQNFTKLMIEKMVSGGWDLDTAAASIEPNAVYAKPKHKKFTFESFVCRKLFNGFQHESFCVPDEPEQRQQLQQRHQFFSRFMELKSKEPMEFLNNSPRSRFGRFCRSKYLETVHPKMELSFFGDLNQRNLVNSGGIPATEFYSGFLEMARWVWLLHCLAFSFDPKISIFQARNGSRFSEVYMESVVRHVVFDDSLDERPQVGFTVFPGFNVGKTVIQCQVYLSGMKSDEEE